MFPFDFHVPRAFDIFDTEHCSATRATWRGYFTEMSEDNLAPPGASKKARRTSQELWHLTEQRVMTGVHVSMAFKTLRDMDDQENIEPSSLERVKRLGEGAFALVEQCWWAVLARRLMHCVHVHFVYPIFLFY